MQSKCLVFLRSAQNIDCPNCYKAGLTYDIGMRATSLIKGFANWIVSSRGQHSLECKSDHLSCRNLDKLHQGDVHRRKQFPEHL